MWTCGTVFWLQDIDFRTLGNIKSLTTWKKGNQKRQHLIAATTIDVPFHQRSPAREGVRRRSSRFSAFASY